MPSDTRRPFSGPEDGDMWISAGEAAALLGLKPDTLSKQRRLTTSIAARADPIPLVMRVSFGADAAGMLFRA